ncbi:MAG: ATP-binding cassette domain-containing protein, partial [Nocardioidaceae bacterium]
MREYLRGARRYLKYTYDDERGPTIIVMVATVLEAVGKALLPLWFGFIATGVAQRDLHDALTCLAGLAVALTFSRAEDFVIASIWQAPIMRAMENMSTDILRLNVGAKTITHLHDSSYLDNVQRLQGDRENLAKIVFSLLRPLNGVIDLAITCVLLWALAPILVLLPLAAVPTVWAHQVVRRLKEQAETAAAQVDRRETHLHAVAVSPQVGKEVKAWALEPWLDESAASSWNQSTSLRFKADLRSAGLLSLAWVPFAVAVIGALIWLADRSAGTPGDVVILLTVAARTRSRLNSLVYMASRGASTGYTFERFDRLHAYHAAEPPGQADVPAQLHEGVRLQGVSYQYPNAAEPALKDVSLHLAAGTTVALVGENGAGKSTLVAILLGLLQPTAGNVVLDGKDVRELDPQAFGQRISAAFQDTPRLWLTPRQIVALGDLDRWDDEAAHEEAIARAGAQKLVAGLSDGMDTQLGA